MEHEGAETMTSQYGRVSRYLGMAVRLAAVAASIRSGLNELRQRQYDPHWHTGDDWPVWVR
jgi:hypothetical protein